MATERTSDDTVYRMAPVEACAACVERSGDMIVAAILFFLFLILTVMAVLLSGVKSDSYDWEDVGFDLGAIFIVLTILAGLAWIFIAAGSYIE